jgi:uncharacterized membrane protein (UPF0127 family)
MKSKSVLLVFLAILAAGLVVYFGFFHDKELPRPEITAPTPLPAPDDHDYSYENPPVFKKEGELRFYDGQSNQKISEIDIEIADNPFDRALGLMFRPEMADTTGMLFIFDNEEIQAFWMRNTIIPLDILYVNAKNEIVDIYKHTKVKSDLSMPSSDPALYVVEVNAGYCDKHGIEEGDLVEF